MLVRWTNKIPEFENLNIKIKFCIFFFFFTVAPCIFTLSSLVYYLTDAQLNIPRRMLKFTLKLTLKCSYML